jgi:hypothetical protein
MFDFREGFTGFKEQQGRGKGGVRACGKAAPRADDEVLRRKCGNVSHDPAWLSLIFSTVENIILVITGEKCRSLMKKGEACLTRI